MQYRVYDRGALTKSLWRLESESPQHEQVRVLVIIYGLLSLLPVAI